MSVKGTQVEDKMRRFKGECAQFSFNRCPIYAHDGASAKFSTNLQETDNSVGGPQKREGQKQQLRDVVASGQLIFSVSDCELVVVLVGLLPLPPVS